MADETVDVKEVTPAEPVPAQEEVSTVVSDDGAKVDRTVYEKVREDMLKYKAEKKQSSAELDALRAEVEALKSAKESDDFEPDEPEDTRTKAKVDILYLVQTDPFVKANLDLIEEKMADNPKLTAKEAIKELKSDFFDGMQKELAKSEPEVPLKQINPKGNSTTRDVIKDALSGKNENADPAQLAAYNATLARLKK
jgi:hypothetical protein